MRFRQSPLTMAAESSLISYNVVFCHTWARVNLRMIKECRLVALFAAILLTGCIGGPPPEPGIGQPVAWSELPGWNQDSLVEVWPGLLAQCPRLGKENKQWAVICQASDSVASNNNVAIRAFIEHQFQPHEVFGKQGSRDGLITGYYQPVLQGSRTPSPRYKYPLYGRPDDLLTIELGELFPELKGKRVRGRLVGNKVVPYYDRAAIDGESLPLRGQELLWIDDPYGSFFLQVQGSGRVQLDDGRQIAVAYADQNGQPYRSIGQQLVEMGEQKREDVSLFSIRQWLSDHPERANALLNTNPSYVFFTLRGETAENPRGSLNVPLTDERSVAVDRSIIPLGSLVWLDTQLPGSERPYRRLMLAQDTGGAIAGPVRADIFFGTGERAEHLAGHMKGKGRLYVILPKQVK